MQQPPDLENRQNFRFNVNDELKNDHTAIFGKSGSGKSTIIKHSLGISDKDRVLIYDPDGTHSQVPAANRFKNKGEYWEGLKLCMASGKPFHIALLGANTVPNFQFFCWCAVAVAGADTPINVLLEEIQQVTGTVESRGYHNDLLTRGRKYGVRVVAISPKPQRCDKDTLDAEHLYCCKLGRHQDREEMAKQLGVTATDIEKMGMQNIDKQIINWPYKLHRIIDNG